MKEEKAEEEERREGTGKIMNYRGLFEFVKFGVLAGQKLRKTVENSCS